MAQRRHQYERAFEAMLRRLRVPYVAVDEARRTLLPGLASPTEGAASLKSFDFVLYGTGSNLLVEVKGRRLATRKQPTGVETADHPKRPRGQARRLECWVGREDVESMRAWGALFGGEFEPAFVFLYSSDERPDLGGAEAGGFDEVFWFEGRWFAPRVVGVHAYARAMRRRSGSWDTVDLSPESFARLSGPLLGRGFHRPWGSNAGPAGPARPPWPAPHADAPWLEPVGGLGLGAG